MQITPKLKRDDFITPQRVQSGSMLAPKRRGQALRRANAKDMTKLREKVVAHIRAGLASKVILARPDATCLVTREAIAQYLAVPEHQVEQVLVTLMLEGRVRREPNDGAHNTKRARITFDTYSGWAPTYWRLRDTNWWMQGIA